MRVLQIVVLIVILGLSFSSCKKIQPDDDSFIIANVFTPNENGSNDVFEVTSNDGSEVLLEIYTRAGVLVFKITAQRCRWDGCSISGQQMANGVYYYYAEIDKSSPKISQTGFFYLYR